MAQSTAGDLKVWGKQATLRAYIELLKEDPANITNQHFRILLKDISPNEIVQVTGGTLKGKPILRNLVLSRFNSYLHLSGIDFY